MKALSIQQPWAWLIVNGYKDIENRSWVTKLRGRFLVHASQKYDHSAMNTHPQRHVIKSILDAKGLKADDLPRGGIVGSVEVLDCVAHHSSLWFDGEFGFILANPAVLKFQPCRGQLNFFTPEIPKVVMHDMEYK